MSRDLVAERFRALVEQVGEECGKPARGWKERVADRLSVDPTYITKITRGTRHVGLTAAERVAGRLGMDVGFFLDPFEGSPLYRDYLTRPSAIGERIRDAYTSAGLTRAEFARRIGAGYTTVWRWEKGKARPTAENLDAASKTLGVPMEQFFGADAKHGAAPDDPEIAAMQALARLAPESRARVLEWAAAKWPANSATAATPAHPARTESADIDSGPSHGQPG